MLLDRLRTTIGTRVAISRGNLEPRIAALDREVGTALDLLALPAYYRRSRRYLDSGPQHFLMYVFGRFSLVRSFMVWLNSQRSSSPALSSSPRVVDTVNVDDVVHKIREDGYCPNLNLSPEILQQLLTFSSLATCYGDGKSAFPFHYSERETAQQRADRPFRLARYNHALSASSALKALASDPQLVDIARKYLRTEPVLISARMWWSLAGSPADKTQQKEAGQNFHYDIDGYRGLAFFFYLTDVKPSAGPHVYVRGTHMKKALRHIVSLHKARTDEEIDKTYGPENQVLLCGPAGSGFAEDIFGFHKGADPEKDDRLIVQVRFGLRDYGTGQND
jgi:hypothetical protein